MVNTRTEATIYSSPEEDGSPWRKRTQARSLPLTRNMDIEGVLPPQLALFSHSQADKSSTGEPVQITTGTARSASTDMWRNITAEALSARTQPSYGVTAVTTLVHTDANSSEAGNTVVMAPYTVSTGPLHTETTDGNTLSGMTLYTTSTGGVCKDAPLGEAQPSLQPDPSLTFALRRAALPVHAQVEPAPGQGWPLERRVEEGAEPLSGCEVKQCPHGDMAKVEVAAEARSLSRAGAETPVTQGDTDMSDEDAVVRLNRQLDGFRKGDLFLGRFEMLGAMHRRRGGTLLDGICFAVAVTCNWVGKLGRTAEACVQNDALYVRFLGEACMGAKTRSHPSKAMSNQHTCWSCDDPFRLQHVSLGIAAWLRFLQ